MLVRNWIILAEKVISTLILFTASENNKTLWCYCFDSLVSGGFFSWTSCIIVLWVVFMLVKKWFRFKNYEITVLLWKFLFLPYSNLFIRIILKNIISMFLHIKYSSTHNICHCYIWFYILTGKLTVNNVYEYKNIVKKLNIKN